MVLAAHAIAEAVAAIRKRRLENEHATGLAARILQRVAEAAASRDEVARDQAEAIAAAAIAIVRAVASGGRLVRRATRMGSRPLPHWRSRQNRRC